MESLEAFYSEERRRASREVTFGSQWRSAGAPGWWFSVFWIADTEELCVMRSPIKDVQEDGTFRRFVLDIPPHFKKNPLRDEEVTMRVLCEVQEEGLVEMLEGWEEHHGAPDGLAWVVARAVDEDEEST